MQYLQFRHGELDNDRTLALATIRRTLRGIMGHGMIKAFETYSNSEHTIWTFELDQAESDGILLGLEDVLKALKPIEDDGLWEVSAWVG